MADTAKTFYGPAQLAAAAATLYTVPASTEAVLRYIRIVNTTGTDRTVTLSVGADAAGTRIVAGMTVPANGFIADSLFVPLTTGQIIQGYASAAAALTVILTGVETTP